MIDNQNAIKPKKENDSSDPNVEKKPVVKKTYNCKLCGESFTRTNSLKRHILSIHEQRRPYACPQCDQKFKIKYHLQKHVERYGSFVSFVSLRTIRP